MLTSDKEMNDVIDLAVAVDLLGKQLIEIAHLRRGASVACEVRDEIIADRDRLEVELAAAKAELHNNLMGESVFPTTPPTKVCTCENPDLNELDDHDMHCAFYTPPPAEGEEPIDLDEVEVARQELEYEGREVGARYVGNAIDEIKALTARVEELEKFATGQKTTIAGLREQVESVERARDVNYESYLSERKRLGATQEQLATAESERDGAIADVDIAKTMLTDARDQIIERNRKLTDAKADTAIVDWMDEGRFCLDSPDCEVIPNDQGFYHWELRVRRTNGNVGLTFREAATDAMGREDGPAIAELKKANEILEDSLPKQESVPAYIPADQSEDHLPDVGEKVAEAGVILVSRKDVDELLGSEGVQSLIRAFKAEKEDRRRRFIIGGTTIADDEPQAKVGKPSLTVDERIEAIPGWMKAKTTENLREIITHKGVDGYDQHYIGLASRALAERLQAEKGGE